MLRTDDRPSKEPQPETIPTLTILLGDRGFVNDPVIIPTLDGGTVVDTDGFLTANLEASTFQLTNYPAVYRERDISSKREKDRDRQE